MRLVQTAETYLQGAWFHAGPIQDVLQADTGPMRMVCERHDATLMSNESDGAGRRRKLASRHRRSGRHVSLDHAGGNWINFDMRVEAEGGWANFPTDIDVDKFRLTVRGHVNQTLSLSTRDILHGLPRVELAAVSQCAGNSRIYMQPRVPGAQWANGSTAVVAWVVIFSS
jgi:DMSO/TMAO reductase YedYZ molybdopterin-dependent catalytic subunit